MKFSTSEVTKIPKFKKSSNVNVSKSQNYDVKKQHLKKKIWFVNTGISLKSDYFWYSLYFEADCHSSPMIPIKYWSVTCWFLKRKLITLIPPANCSGVPVVLKVTKVQKRFPSFSHLSKKRIYIVCRTFSAADSLHSNSLKLLFKN